jgi:quaternary ammonium compound-resistance protein SugE
MAWLFVFIAGLFEIVWAIAMKYSDGFSKLWPSAITIVGMLISFFLLSYALKTLPVGTTYAAWTGIGAAGTAVMGMILFGESREAVRLFCIGLIIAGILGLQLVDSH